ncbi:MAG TPA: zf-HC2 domain-containing protein [Gemmatimonadaceae bacterium]|nr:zf-HC2 domain-containing protein [Gemmatimonadaceae bacterium]
MNDCMNAEVRDALPDLLHGRLSDLDTITMRAHIETCADCREEVRLLEEVLGSAPIAPRIDVAGIVAALPAAIPAVADQLVASAPARARRQSSLLWKVAAVAALLVTGSLTFANARRQAVVSPETSASIATPATSGRAPASAQSQAVSVTGVTNQVVASVNAVGKSNAGLSLTGGVQDLSDDQLESLVNGLDNVEAIPSGEPEPMTISVDEDSLQ